VSLAPSYDLLSTGVYHTEAFPMEGAKWPEIDLAIPLPNQLRFANVTRQGLVAGGAALGLPAPICEREIDSIASRIGPELDTIIASVEQDNAQLPTTARQYLGGELRLLRAIRHIIVAQMVQKIADVLTAQSGTAQ
jgi:serine/threonine-protein kinase HipA